MTKPVTIIKIDPVNRLVARLSIKPSVQGVRQIIGCANIGHRTLIANINGEKLIVAARVDQDPAKPLPEWRIRGCDNVVGVGFLFGTLQREMQGMWHCPVDIIWVNREIVWCQPGENAPAAEVAERHGIPLANGAEHGNEEEAAALLAAQKAAALAGPRAEGGEDEGAPPAQPGDEG